jgi:hypothetical protein
MIALGGNPHILSISRVKFLPPIIALAMVVGWLTFRHHATAAAREKATILEQRIAQALSSSPDPTGDRSLAARVREQRGALVKPGEPIDWKRVADRFNASPGGLLDARFRRPQPARSWNVPRRTVEALDEIDALDLPLNADKQLEGMLLAQLANKDPRQALEKYGRSDRLRKQVTSRGPSPTAISRWAEDDPAAANDWFDDKIADGLFDSRSLSGRNQDRIRFEAAIIGALLPADTSTAVQAPRRTA